MPAAAGSPQFWVCARTLSNASIGITHPHVQAQGAFRLHDEPCCERLLKRCNPGSLAGRSILIDQTYALHEAPCIQREHCGEGRRLGHAFWINMACFESRLLKMRRPRFNGILPKRLVFAISPGRRRKSTNTPEGPHRTPIGGAFNCWPDSSEIMGRQCAPVPVSNQLTARLLFNSVATLPAMSLEPVRVGACHADFLESTRDSVLASFCG